MNANHLKIGFVRRGYSDGGGAEAYLKRLAEGLTGRGHEAQLLSTEAWPANEWLFGPIKRVGGATPLRFADALEELRVGSGCDVLMSLERVWQCDVYRAGDGVHRAWLQRRARFDSAVRKVKSIFNQKHRGILRLEESLFAHGGARHVIANSAMVKREIVELYGYPADEVHVVHNGVPAAVFACAAQAQRTSSRAALGLASEEIAVLFVGSGWMRKGLRFALRAIEACGIPQMRLLVAGKGNQAKHRSRRAQFLGVVTDLPALYAAADIFLLPTLYDPFSNACLEAMAAGLPVITTRANGFAEIVEEGKHGSVLDEPDDFMALREALHFWSAQNRRGEARPEIQRRAAELDISGNVARTLEVLLQAAANAEFTSGKIRNT